MLSLRITLHDPELAAAVANRMVEELNRFNVERRRSQSGEERIFTERRLKEVQKELTDAEAELVAFLQRNRQFSESSVASVTARSLERKVSLKQEVLATMSRSYEEARINEVRDTPVLTVIDQAEPPAWKSFPKRTISVLVALVAGPCSGSAWPTCRGKAPGPLGTRPDAPRASWPPSVRPGAARRPRAMSAEAVLAASSSRHRVGAPQPGSAGRRDPPFHLCIHALISAFR